MRVDGDKTSEHEGGKEGCQERPRITEILFYASVLSAKSGAEGFPTPPSSSPSGLHTSTPHTENTTTRKTELRIHALPLSSDLLYHSSLTPIHTNDEPLKEDEARFLPPQFPSPPVSEPSPLKKSARVATLFDDATERRKKARRKGGDMVAKTVATVEGSEQAIDVPSSKKISVGQEFADAGSQQKQSHTTHEMSSLISTSEQDPATSKTQKRLPTEQRKSTLSRVASNTSSQPKPPNSKDPSIEARNKGLLSRIIMAGMRIYGLQQRKRVIKPTTQTEHPTDPESDEYKLIYHQTFKGSYFALVSLFSSYLPTPLPRFLPKFPKII